MVRQILAVVVMVDQSGSQPTSVRVDRWYVNRFDTREGTDAQYQPAVGELPRDDVTEEDGSRVH